ncbi:hypothetical protein EDB89DRAFT_1914413 [Lactarius sanguifluus]|nr:hypothetical protein EDB89DRAFT_1914413 [Lactarius sanguifluus]
MQTHAVGVKGLGPHASAAMSEWEWWAAWTPTGSSGCQQLRTLLRDAKTSHRRPPGSGMHRVRVAKAARECGTLGNARGSKVVITSCILLGKKTTMVDVKMGVKQ